MGVEAVHHPGFGHRDDEAAADVAPEAMASFHIGSRAGASATLLQQGERQTHTVTAGEHVMSLPYNTSTNRRFHRHAVVEATAVHCRHALAHAAQRCCSPVGASALRGGGAGAGASAAGAFGATARLTPVD
jgi:hypothetical protein